MTDYQATFEERYTLGRLCRRGHDWKGSDRSLRYRGARPRCVECCQGRPVNEDEYRAQTSHLEASTWFSQSDIKRFWSKVVKGEGCWDWLGWKDRRGYSHFYLQGKEMLASHFSWSLAHGDRPVPQGMCVCHACDNPPCVRPDHLWVGTQAENIADEYAKNRQAKREDHWAVKYPEKNLRAWEYRPDFTDDTVRAILRLASSGLSQRAVARACGVTRLAVQLVVRGEIKKHITQPVTISPLQI